MHLRHFTHGPHVSLCFYWSKVLFEDVNFKASFEGKEEKVLTESERKRISDVCGREVE